MQIQIMPISHFLMIFGAHMNTLFIIKVKIIVLIYFEELKEMNWAPHNPVAPSYSSWDLRSHVKW